MCSFIVIIMKLFFPLLFLKYRQGKKKDNGGLEMETWHDLANVYTSLSQWRDAEICLSKSEAIDPHSASRLHSSGASSLYMYKEIFLFPLKSELFVDQVQVTVSLSLSWQVYCMKLKGSRRKL